MSQKYCSIYIQQTETQLTSQEIEKQLREGKIGDKIEALKQLIINIIHDDSFPRSVMTVINTLVPLQTDTHDIKKVLLYYWEIIEKVNAKGDLRDEIVLVCNSIRKDLLHPNEWVRGRTLRLVSRIMYRGVLEPISSAIIDSLEHKHVYVRRNAVVAINRIFLHFGDEIFSDIDENMEKILQNETDLSTKRNAFQLLFHANQGKALQYLNSQINSETADEMGDILQLAVLELFRKTCKFDPSQKSRLLKAVFYFAKSKSNSVLLECANTLVQISNSATTLKMATSIYLQILLTITDNNVKMIVLDKITQIYEDTQPKFLEEQAMDITNILNNQSVDIRKKALLLIEKLTNQTNIQQIFQILIKEVKKCIHSQDEQKEYLSLIFDTMIKFTAKFGDVLSEEALNLITESLLTNSKLDDAQSIAIKEILIIIAQNNQGLRSKLIEKIIQRFYDIQNIQLYKAALWIISEFAADKNIVAALEEIKKSIGNLPIEEAKNKNNDQNNSKNAESDQKDKEQENVKTKKIKTVILADGSYGQEVVEESDVVQHEVGQEIESKFREFLIQNSNLTSSMTRTIMKLLYRIKLNRQQFNKHSAESLLIFCSLLRYYAANISKVDQDAIEKLNLGIRLITNPSIFKASNYSWLTSNSDFLHPLLKKQQMTSQNRLENQLKTDKQKHIIAKQADDVITIRGLKGKTVLGELDIEDEEQNEGESILKGVGDEQQDFVSKLTNLVQLTGFSDPIYAEAFVNIHKFDISFDVLLINRTSKVLQNISVEFVTQGELQVLEKAIPVTLQPNQSTHVKTSIKFSTQDIGLIFGNINYENMAGKEQAYLVTKEINIDLIDFILPADIGINSFRQLWAKYEWENRITFKSNQNDFQELVDTFEEKIKIRYVGEKTDLENSQFICANFYAQTKLDDDFLVNLSAEIKDDKIDGYVIIRAKNKGIVVNLGEKFKVLQNKVEK